jgi:hypothetical protein
MNDQTIQVVCRRSDAPTFEKLGFRFEGGFGVTNSKLRIDTSDGAESSAVVLGEATVKAPIVGRRGSFGTLPKGVPFFGCHGPGATYDPGVFATGGKRFHYASVPSGSPDPSVALDASCELDPKRRRLVQRYQATLLLVKARFIAHLQQHSPGLCRSEQAPSPQRRIPHE